MTLRAVRVCLVILTVCSSAIRTAAATPEGLSAKATAVAYFEALRAGDLGTAFSCWSVSVPKLEDRIAAAAALPPPVIESAEVVDVNADTTRVLVRFVQTQGTRSRNVVVSLRDEDGVQRIVSEEPAALSTARLVANAATFSEAVALVSAATEPPDAIAAALASLASGARAKSSYSEAVELLSLASRLLLHFDPSPAAWRPVDRQFAAVYTDLGNFDLAMECLNFPFERQRETSRTLDEAYGLFRAYQMQGKLAEADDCAEEGLQAALSARDATMTLQFVNALGTIDSDRGAWSSAMQHWDYAYDLSRALRLPLFEAAVLFNISLAEHRTGDLTAALKHRREALRIEKQIGAKADAAHTLSDLAYLHRTRGEDEAAAECLTEAIELAREVKNARREGWALVSRAKFAALDGDVAAAREAMNAARRVWQNPSDRQLMHLGLVSLYIHLQNGELDEAASDSRDILEYHVRAEDTEGIAEQLTFSAQIALARGDYETAVRFATAASEHAMRENIWNFGARSYYLAAKGYHALGDDARARDRLSCAIELLENTRAKFETADEVRGFTEDRLEPYRLAVEILLDRGDVAGALHYAERSRATGLLRSALGAVSASDVRKASAEFTLEQSTTALEFIWTDDAVTCFIISPPRSVQVHRYAAAPAEIERLIDDYDQALAGRFLDFRRPARALYDVLFAPLEPQLSDSKRLLVSPDGKLWKVPFAALQDERARFVIDRYEVVYIRSLALHARVSTPAGSSSFTAFANPDIPAELRGKLAEVPALEEVTRRTAALYAPNAQLVSGRDASEHLLKTLHAEGLVHFATHARANSRTPEYSYVVLAEGRGEDGRVEAKEIVNLKWGDVQLVTLAACETARGKAAEGEGLLGLTWAFQAAGARNVVATLWKVDERSMGELSLQMHRALRRGVPASESLRQSVVELKKRPEFAHPFFWGAVLLLQ